MDDQPPDRLLAIANALLIVALFVIAWQALGYELVPGVVVHHLGPCALDWHRARPALVLACPGQDMLRLWPLPLVQPWFEDAVLPELAPAIRGALSRA